METHTAEQAKAWADVMTALEAWAKVAPKTPEPTAPIEIKPTKAWANASNFRLGMNWSLNCWTAGSAGGADYLKSVPVLIVPMRPVDLRRYRDKRRNCPILAALTGEALKS